MIYINAKQDIVKCIMGSGIFKEYRYITENTMLCPRCFGAHIFCTDTDIDICEVPNVGISIRDSNIKLIKN